MTKSVAEMTREAIIAKAKKEIAGTADYVSTPTVWSTAAVTPVVAPMVAPDDTHKLYSEVFGAVPPKGGDFYVKVYRDEDWDDEDHAFIPNLAEFNAFVIDHSVLSMEMRALQHNLKVLVVGPSGSGKTTLQKFICAVIRQPYLRINGRQDMESDTLLGKPWVKHGAMEFMLGELPKAMLKGWFTTFDEPWKTPSGIQMSLTRMYERDGILQLDDMPGTLTEKQIVPKNTFRMVLCDNVVGTGDGAAKYGATMIQDGSTINRMDVILKMGYLTQEQEVDMLIKMHPSIERMMAGKMVRLSALLRVGYEQEELSAAISPRNLDAWGMMYVNTGDMRLAFDMTISERYAEDSERAAIEEHYRNVFG